MSDDEVELFGVRDIDVGEPVRHPVHVLADAVPDALDATLQVREYASEARSMDGRPDCGPTTRKLRWFHFVG